MIPPIYLGDPHWIAPTTPEIIPREAVRVWVNPPRGAWAFVLLVPLFVLLCYIQAIVVVDASSCTQNKGERPLYSRAAENSSSRQLISGVRGSRKLVFDILQ